MELSLFLAELMGVSFILMALAGLVRPKLLMVAVRDFDHNAFSTFGIGILTMIAGIAIVLTHNIWDGTWRVWVTVLGWATLLKGFIYMTAPQSLLRLNRGMIKGETSVRWVMLVLLLVGLYLTYKGMGY